MEDFFVKILSCTKLASSAETNFNLAVDLSNIEIWAFGYNNNNKPEYTYVITAYFLLGWSGLIALLNLY